MPTAGATIEPETIQQLTMATKAQQKAWIGLFRDASTRALPEGVAIRR
jgi:hypothetical protein